MQIAAVSLFTLLTTAGCADGATQDDENPIAEASSPDREHVFAFDIKDRGKGIRARGELKVTASAPTESYPSCSLTAPTGTFIVPLEVTYLNDNNPSWNEPFEPVTGTVDVSVPDSIATYENSSEETCDNGVWGFNPDSAAHDLGVGQSASADLILLGVPQNKSTKVILSVKITSDYYAEPKTKKFSMMVRG